ncbi:phage tail protein I [Novosphingobium humi]|uniref:Phage tail protein I n=1 Tax=Novosphingobium humi TaxID=2282397 RepID=A0ABY7TTL3_9SPHN|nr:phage tail protein I [Novosphingobium humi]WCT76290.1 phage tail protein I [Novosphingobium humi]WJS97247.1 phage tail protein I [Novosphingobium humi]
MANNPSLLPPNATRLEHALAAATARITAIPTPLTDLWRPDTIPASILPWLAWSLSVDRWRPSWSEEQRRAATAQAIPNAKIRGSRAAAEAVIADYDPRITLTEWWEEGGSGVPYTFFVTLPLDGLFDTIATASFAAELYRDLVRVKPARAHFTLRQKAMAHAALPMVAAARAMRAERWRAAMADPDPADDLKLQSEDGEPLEGPDGLAWEDE